MHVVRMTVPCRSGTVVACPMVWGKGESRCREQGENESWIVRCYPGAGYDGCMAGCLSVHLFFAHSPQTSSSAWDIPPDKKRKRDEYSCRRGKQRERQVRKKAPQWFANRVVVGFIGSPAKSTRKNSQRAQEDDGQALNEHQQPPLPRHPPPPPRRHPPPQPVPARHPRVAAPPAVLPPPVSPAAPGVHPLHPRPPAALCAAAAAAPELVREAPPPAQCVAAPPPPVLPSPPPPPPRPVRPPRSPLPRPAVSLAAAPAPALHRLPPAPGPPSPALPLPLPLRLAQPGAAAAVLRSRPVPRLVSLLPIQPSQLALPPPSDSFRVRLPRPLPVPDPSAADVQVFSLTAAARHHAPTQKGRTVQRSHCGSVQCTSGYRRAGPCWHESEKRCQRQGMDN